MHLAFLIISCICLNYGCKLDFSSCTIVCWPNISGFIKRLGAEDYVHWMSEITFGVLNVDIGL